MADIQRIIQTIVSNPRIAAGGNFAGRVYRDQPILITAPHMENFTPPKIREMRKMARGNGSDEKIFYEQGMFMESFEDSFDYRGEFSQYFPTYQGMSDPQLRGYFSWRTRVRRGIVEKTSLSFAFVYLYELLNRIGVRSPEDGFRALKDFRTAYREIDPRIDDYAALWLKDYVIYHNLDKSFLDELPAASIDNAIRVLLDCESHGVEEVFSALNSLSSYDLTKSRFFKLHPDDVKNVLYRVFPAVSGRRGGNPEKDARERFLGRICSSSYFMFKSAVFHHRDRPENRVYEIGDCHKYICENGEWSCERFLRYGRNNKRIGALLKTVDYLMRRNYGCKSTLQCGKTDKRLTAKIEREIAEYDRDKRNGAPPAIDIDAAKLPDIRASALAVQNALLAGEPEEDERAPANPGGEIEREGRAGLNDAERRLVLRLLHGGKCDDPARPRDAALSIVIDGINEKLFDAFNDTVIVGGEDAPELVEEYREELKRRFCEA